MRNRQKTMPGKNKIRTFKFFLQLMINFDGFVISGGGWQINPKPKFGIDIQLTKAFKD